MSRTPCMKFRQWPKRRLRALVPVELEKAVAERASEQGRPENEVVAEILSIGLGIEPARFGIEPMTAAAT